MGTGMRRKFSEDDKIQILQEGAVNGAAQTIRKYDIGQSLFYKWKKAFINGGITLLNDKSKNPELIRLQYEN